MRGRVDEHVDVAHLGQDVGDDLRGLIEVGDVVGHADGGGGVGELGADPLQLFGAAGGEHHESTAARVLLGQTFADAAVRAGDELRMQPEITAGAARSR